MWSPKCLSLGAFLLGGVGLDGWGELWAAVADFRKECGAQHSRMKWRTGGTPCGAKAARRH